MSNQENILADIIKKSKMASANDRTGTKPLDDKSETKSVNCNLVGVAYIRAINTPQYFTQMARDAYSIFEDPDAVDSAIKILFTKEPDKEKFLTPNLVNKTNDVMKKFALTGGSFVEFIECKVDFDLKDKLPLVHDIVSEITLRDGIVTKIEKTNLERAYDKPKKTPKNR